MSFLKYFWAESPDTNFTISVAESVTAGAVSTALCAKPGASVFFKGGVVVYSVESKKMVLNIDLPPGNHADPFTALSMAKAVCKLFKSRIGISTVGFASPMNRPENKEKNECELIIPKPYAIICLYDSLTGKEIIHTYNYPYDANKSVNLQRAQVQAETAIKCRDLYFAHIKG